MKEFWEEDPRVNEDAPCFWKVEFVWREAAKKGRLVIHTSCNINTMAELEEVMMGYEHSHRTLAKIILTPMDLARPRPGYGVPELAEGE